jgi:pimeloyl-ACP methyl ester carboxylesterase
MERRYLAYIVFLLSVLTVSSSYLTWAADRGFGTITVERFGIESSPGRSVNFTVFAPTDSSYIGDMPAVLTVHGVSGTKEGMFAFNIELARRNFTVISIDLAGHGESVMPFDPTDIEGFAADCYAALEFVRTNYSDVSDSIYGFVGHSFGFHVGLAMYDLPNAPAGIVAVGPPWLETITDFPGNMLMAMGTMDEIASPGVVMNTLADLTGVSNPVSDETYGSFESGTAYRVIFAVANHISEATNDKIVSESVAWMINSVQGETQFARTLSPELTIFGAKTIGLYVGTFSFFVLTIPLLLVSVSMMSEVIRPEIYAKTYERPERNKRMLLSLVQGLAFTIALVGAGYLGISLESGGIVWVNGMDLSGIAIFLLVYPFVILVLMMLMIGKTSTSSLFASAGIRKDKMKDLLITILKSAVPAIICIAWLLLLIIPSAPILAGESLNPLMLIRFPNGIRVLSLTVLMLYAIPFLAADAAWMGIFLKNETEESSLKELMNVGRLLIYRMLPTGVMVLAVVLGSLALGLVWVQSVMLGVLMLQLIIATILSTIFITFSKLKYGNPWPGILLGAFIIGLILAAGAPLA